MPSPQTDLRGADQRVYSQNGEDGILGRILATIGSTNEYYVEFGVESGLECNTRLLRENGWRGLLMDGSHEDLAINLHREYITAENINQLFVKYQAPERFDLLSIDLDYNDFWIWKAVHPRYQPRIVIIEWNCSISPYRSLTVPYDPNGKWDHTSYFGASIRALAKLGQQKGYTLVAADRRSVNLFFVQDTFKDRFRGAGDIAFIHPDWVWSHPKDPMNRAYVEY